ncbi:LADA_0F07712g1_1 [Lachancea dasiensis]|uniref:LADA_0F07712g1_1 n=1 Tax=Lachancea dasiensis TaxID=1072105 RepID=A0A1G4JKD3_9SACH|nr:LADA_0F07712g1_1 [Lachancea dasiensis]
MIRLFGIILLANVVWAVGITMPNATGGTRLRAWNAVKKLTDDPTALQKLYFHIAGVDDQYEDQYPAMSEDSLIDQVTSILGVHDTDAAALFPWHYALETGFSMDTSDENYFILNGKRFYSPDDLFYLKSTDLSAQNSIPRNSFLNPEDVVIGENSNAPVVQFYGCDRVAEWEAFNRNLLVESQAGKLRFVWRSTCQNNLPLNIDPTAITLTIKDSTGNTPISLPLDVPPEFARQDGVFYANQLDEVSLSDLDMKVTALICDFHARTNNFTKTLTFMRQVVNNFPVLTKELSRLPGSYEQLAQAADFTAEQGIDHSMLGLYINGQYHKLSSLDEGSVTRAITLELQQIHLLSTLLRQYENVSDRDSIHLAKKVLGTFSSLSLKTLQNSQPVKYDLHRIAGFSESVVYFNDIENDPQYKEGLTDNIGEFFKQSEYGQLPAYRENWNEVVFVINFSDLESRDTSEALKGLLRAAEVVSNGHPQRIGLLPFATDDFGMELVQKIYETKRDGLEHVSSYLKHIAESESPHGCTFGPIPPVLDILEAKLKISDTSIIVNGEIYPFKSNLWNYLIAKVIKKDVSHIKDELRAINSADALTAREILHKKSFAERNLKLLPDYFEDSTYFASDVRVLESLGSRKLELMKSHSHKPLHTITIVDDFDTRTGLERLINFLRIELLGVRLRIIHAGVDSKQWKRVRSLAEKFEMVKLEKTLPKIKLNDAANLVDHSIINKWLPELPYDSQYRTSFVTLNGRYFHLEKDEILTSGDYEMVLQREAVRIFDAARALQEVFPEFLKSDVNPDFVEMVSGILAAMFYSGQNTHSGIDFTAESTISRLNLGEFIDVNAYNTLQISNDDRKVDVVLIIDVLEERTQKLLNLASKLTRLGFVNVQIHLLPTKDLKVFPIHRIWQDTPLDFVSDSSSSYYVDIESPSHWHLELEANGNIDFSYMLLEVNAFETSEVPSKTLVEGQGNVCLQLLDSDNVVLDTTFTSETFGYAQFKIKNFGRGYKIQSCSSDYEVSSFSLIAKSDYVPVDVMSLTDLSPSRAYVKLQKSHNDKQPSRTNYLNTINVLYIIESQKHEDNFKLLVANLLESNPNQEVKFWLLMGENPTSAFKPFLTFLTNIQGKISFEYLSYDWPRWLRPQRFRGQELSAAKVLLLDFLLPSSVHKILYIGPEARLDNLENLWNFEFDTVFCLPRAYHSGGTPYWKEGYWLNFLKKHNLKFHSVEPAFIVNLAKYRNDHAGDKLRIHYQRLSAGINFLGKLDQDLINDMQPSLPISTLKGRLVAKVPVEEQFSNKLLEIYERKYLSEKVTPQSTMASISHDEL